MLRHSFYLGSCFVIFGGHGGEGGYTYLRERKDLSDLLQWSCDKPLRHEVAGVYLSKF